MYSVLMGKCKGKRELGRNSDRWKDNIKICLQEIEWEGDVTRMGERRSMYSVLVGKCKGKRALGRSGGRMEDNIEIFLPDKERWAYYIDKWPVTSGFQKMWEIYCVAKKLLLASHEGLLQGVRKKCG